MPLFRISFSSIISIVLLAVVCVTVFGVIKIRKRNAQLRQEMRELKRESRNYQIYINDVAKANKYVGRKFPIVKMEDINGEVISTDFSSYDSAILLFFKAQSCQPCLITQIKIINQIKQTLRHADKVPIIAFANDTPNALKAYMRSFQIKYRLISDQEQEILRRPFDLFTPLVLFVDSKNTIIRSHIPSPNLPQFSVLFYNDLESLVDLSKPLFSTHLDGADYISVVTGKYNLDPIATLMY